MKTIIVMVIVATILVWCLQLLSSPQKIQGTEKHIAVPARQMEYNLQEDLFYNRFSLLYTGPP
jgi:hypothetical protein